MEFKFIEFNHRRKQRGTRAARVEITDDCDTYLLWMNKSDIAKNMMCFGKDPELVKAREAYGA